MPKFQVELNDGRKYIVEADTQPTTEEVSQYLSQNVKTQATEKDFLPIGERLSGGFRTKENLQQVREQQRAERGLAPQTPLEPTGFNLRNLLDLPADIADIIGPSMPILGASVGGVMAGAASLPTGGVALAGVGAAGAVGGAVAQALRQRIGQTMGFDQGTIIEQLGDIAQEGASGAIQEVGGVFLGRMINATKLQMLNTANKLLEKRGAEGFVKGWGSLATHMDKAKTQFALEAVKRGDTRVVNRIFADKDFADKFAKKLFFGEDGNIAKQIFILGNRPNSKEAVKSLFREFVGIDDIDLETIIAKGVKVNQYNNPNIIMKMGQQINNGLDTMFDNAGTELESARKLLAKAGKNIDVSRQLTQFNSLLAQKLENVGFLIKEGEGLFSINPKFAGTTTGSAQNKIFSQLVTRFFGGGDDALIRMVESGDREALLKLANRETVFNINNPINFGEFIEKLKSIDVQISGNEFKAIGKLSPELTLYLRGLRQIPVAVEQQLGLRGINAGRVGLLTKEFEELAESASLLRQGTKIKSPVQIESALQKMVRIEPGSTMAKQISDLNLFLKKNLKIDFQDELKSFRAAQAIKNLEKPLGNTDARSKVIALMEGAFHDEKANAMINSLKETVDNFLPSGTKANNFIDSLRIGEVSEISSVAKALHRDAASLLRGKFLFSSLIGPLTGGAIGGATLGPIGGALGIASGIALQQPGILRFLIKQSAKMSNREIEQFVLRGLGPVAQQTIRTSPATLRLLKELIEKR